jgi:hypothetical protein
MYVEYLCIGLYGNITGLICFGRSFGKTMLPKKEEKILYLPKY